MMKFDPTLPPKLQETQEWFASIITRPIDENSQMIPTSPSGNPMAEEAKQYIAPSPTLQPHQRIQIYNQQYWWRLLSILHENFPLVTRLFGYHDFNRLMGFPYLVKYPADHWSLNALGHKLPRWIREEYSAKDKLLILDAAKLDWTFNAAFTAGSFPPLSSCLSPKESDLTQLLDQKLYLQPHIEVLKMKYDLPTCREEFLKQDPDYWVDHDFPELPKEKPRYFFVIYRTPKNCVTWKEISNGEFQLLKLFKKGISIENACQQLEEKQPLPKEAANHLAEWFQEWTVRGWLSPKTNLPTLPQKSC